MLAAYVTPESYGLGAESLVATETDEHSAFLHEIRRRIDLGRAAVFTTLAEALSDALTSAYRHQIFYSQRDVRGKIHTPRYVTSLAYGGQRGIPVIRAQRQTTTPENLLVSEGIQKSLRVSEMWSAAPGREGVFARALGDRLQRLDARSPWADLRSQPRPVLDELVSMVRGRTVAGIVDTNNPALEIADLFGTPAGDAIAFRASVSTLYMLLSRDRAFADKVFELLCLAWLMASLDEVVDDSTTWPSRIQGGKGQPLWEGSLGAVQYRIYFQSGRPIGSGRWTVRRSAGKRARLRGIPDLLLEIADRGVTRFVLLDAKNRGWSSRSDVAYKLLGYKENLHLTPYAAVGIFPGSSGPFHSVRLVRGDHRVYLVRVPLTEGRRVFRRLARALI